MQTSSSSSYGDGGGVALSHVYIKSPPFRCNIPGALGVMYDDGNKLLLVPSLGKVFSWPVNLYPPPQNPNTTFIKDGPVFSARFSLDGKILAIQRSGQEVEFVNREDCTEFRQRCKIGTDRILGFFWIDCPSGDIVFVTTSGLEIYSLYLGRNGLKLVDLRRSNVGWYVYTHESRLVLLASGMQCKTLCGYQFSAGGIIQLPKFDMLMTKSDTNRKPVLAPNDVRIALMYGRLYCLQVDRIALQLHMYRFYRDAVVPQGSIPMYSRNVAISIVDNVLLVHQIDSKVVLVYDILSTPKMPICAPLPLAIRQCPMPVASTLKYAREANSQSSANIDNIPPLTATEASVYGEGWVFVYPDIILDHAHGMLWKVFLDLEAVAASSSDISSLLAFLQRRRTEAEKAKGLSLGVLRSMILERRPLPLVSNAMKVVASSYSQVISMETFKSTSLQRIPTSHVLLVPANDNEGDSEEHFADNVSRLNTLQKSESPKIVTITNSLESTDDENHSDCMSDDNNFEIYNSQQTEITKLHVEGFRKSSLHKVASNAGIFSEPSASAQEKDVERNSKLIALNLKVDTTSSPVISPAEMNHGVFSVVQEEIAGDIDYFVAVILEYLYSLSAEEVHTHEDLYILLVDLLVREERYWNLHQLIAAKIVEPSKLIALQLMMAGRNHWPTRKLGMDMLRLLHCHAEYARALLEDGCLLEGLRYVRQHKVEAIPPTEFLEKAASSSDPLVLVAVFRFCCDSVPNFQLTRYFDSYHKVIAQALANEIQ